VNGQWLEYNAMLGTATVLIPDAVRRILVPAYFDPIWADHLIHADYLDRLIQAATHSQITVIVNPTMARTRSKPLLTRNHQAREYRRDHSAWLRLHKADTSRR